MSTMNCNCKSYIRFDTKDIVKGVYTRISESQGPRMWIKLKRKTGQKAKSARAERLYYKAERGEGLVEIQICSCSWATWVNDLFFHYIIKKYKFCN